MRFSVAIGGDLLRRFDHYREEHRHANRSDAVRGLMRDALIEEAVTRDDAQAMGVVTLIYDHHAGNVAERLTGLQHDHLANVVTTTHVHLDNRRCLEVVLLRGEARLVRELADGLIGTKGVETGRLVLTAAESVGGREHAHPHPHGHAADAHVHERPKTGRRAKGKA